MSVQQAQQHQAHTRAERGTAAVWRGWQWWHGEGGGGGMERVAAVGHGGWADGEGGQHVSVDGQYVRVGGTCCGGRTHRLGLWVCNGEVQNMLVALVQPEGMGVGQVVT